MRMQRIDGDEIARELLAAEHKRNLRFAYFVVGIAALAVVAYVAYFSHHAVGGPDDWAAFGDYFGGLLNPAIGIVTVVLVVKTLQATRSEADLTRQQLQQQIAHSQRELQLSEMHKRLEGVYGEWTRACEAKASNVYRLIPGTTNQAQLIPHGPKTVGEALNHPEFQEESRKLVDSIVGAAYDGYWKKDYSRFAELLMEMSDYCDQYEAAAGNSILADYYRKRVFMAATTLWAMRVIGDTQWDSLRPTTMG